MYEVPPSKKCLNISISVREIKCLAFSLMKSCIGWGVDVWLKSGVVTVGRQVMLGASGVNTCHLINSFSSLFLCRCNTMVKTFKGRNCSRLSFIPPPYRPQGSTLNVFWILGMNYFGTRYLLFFLNPLHMNAFYKIFRCTLQRGQQE